MSYCKGHVSYCKGHASCHCEGHASCNWKGHVSCHCKGYVSCQPSRVEWTFLVPRTANESMTEMAWLQMLTTSLSAAVTVDRDGMASDVDNIAVCSSYC